MSPAYHVYFLDVPGATTCMFSGSPELMPVWNPSLCRTLYSSSCGWSPTRLEGVRSLALKVTMPALPFFSTFLSFATMGGRALKPGLSGTTGGRALVSSTAMQSPAFARRMSGSTGVPGLRPLGLPSAS